MKKDFHCFLISRCLLLAMLIMTDCIAASQPMSAIDIHKIKSTQLLTGPYSYFVPPYSYYYFHHMDKLDFKLDWVRRAGTVYSLKEPTDVFKTNYIYNK